MRLYPVRLNTSNQPIDFVDLDNVMRIRVQEESLVISPKDGQEIILTYANTTALWTALTNFKTVLDNTTGIDEWYVTKSESGRDLDTLNLYCVVRQQLRDQSVTITMTNKAVLTYNFTTVLEAKTFADNLKIALDALPPQSMGGGVSLFKDLSDVPSLSANPGKVLSVTADGLGVYWVDPLGATGPEGPQGPIGPSGTITIGTVTTGAAGSNVIITNTGTPSAAILNITIPRGSQGLQGIQGLQGLQGIQGEPGQPGLDGSPGVKGDDGRSAKEIFIDLGYLPIGSTDQQFYDYLGAQPLTVIRGGVDESLDTLKKLADAFQEADVAEITARNQAISDAIAAASTNYLPQSSLGTTVQPYDDGLTSLASITTLGVVMATGLNTFETRSVGTAQSSFILDRQSGDIRYLAIGGTANNSSQLNGQPGSYYQDWNNLTSKPATFPPSFHVHAIGDVTDLQSILDGKQALGNYSLVGHTHSIPDIVDLQAILDTKLSTADISWTNISGKPTVFPPAPHGHVVDDIANLQTILDSKQISSPVLNSVSLISTDGLLKNTGGVITSVNVGTTTAGSILDRSSGDSRYYQLASVVDDSLKLGGQLPAYYLNWNNFTNRPTTLAGYGITDQVALVSGNITGSAASLTTPRTIGMTGDVVWTSAPFNGTSNVTGVSVLATVNANVGSFGSAIQIPRITVNSKGLITAVTSVNIEPSWSSITSKPTTLSGYGITDSQPLDSNLTTIAGLVGIGYLQKTGGATWELVEAPSGGVSSWNDLTDKPLVFPPSDHTHEISSINGLLSLLDTKITIDDLPIARPINQVWTSDGVNNTFALDEGNTGFGTLITIDGLVQRPDIDFTITSGVISFVQIPESGSSITAGQFGSFVNDFGASWSTILDKPLTFPPESHSHSDATTLQAGFLSILDKTKLDGIQELATANDTDANLKNRNNHTGTQAISTITNLQTTLDGKSAVGHLHADATTTVSGFMSASDKVKLDDIQVGATANDTNANLLNRLNHTGTQEVSTISGLQTILDAKAPSDNPVFTGIASGGSFSSANMYLDGLATSYRQVSWFTSGQQRWFIGITPDITESGSNVGGDLSIFGYNDAGSYLNNPMTINRASGIVNFGVRPTFAGATPWDSSNLTPVFLAATNQFTANQKIVTEGNISLTNYGFGGAELSLASYQPRIAFEDRSTDAKNLILAWNGSATGGDFRWQFDTAGDQTYTRTVMRLSVGAGDSTLRVDDSIVPTETTSALSGYFKGLIATGVDLNTMTTPGVYHLNSNANASLALNYPAISAGLLEVFNNASAAFIYQRYTAYGSPGTGRDQQYFRGFYNSIWQPWRKSLDDQNMVKATGAELAAGTNDTSFVTPKSVADAMALVTLTDAATIAVDLASGVNFVVTLGGNRTLGAPTNAKPGMSGTILIKQDGAGNRTLAYNAAWKPFGTTPSLTTTANYVDLMTWFVETSGKVRFSLAKGGTA